MVLIFIILGPVFLIKNKISYESSNCSLTLFVNKQNCESLKEKSKKEDFVKNNVVKNQDDFLIDYNNFRSMLQEKEYDMLSFLIDECLKDKTDIFCALLSKVESGYKLLNSMKRDRRSIKRQKNDIINLSKEERKKFFKMQKSLHKRFENLKNVKKIFLKDISFQLNIHIKNSKLFFYIFISDFIIEIIDFMIIKLSITNIELYHVLALEHLELKGKNLVDIVYTIDLPNIISMLTECILHEIPRDNLEFYNLEKNMKIVNSILTRFYKNFDKFLKFYDTILFNLRKIIHDTIVKNYCNKKCK